MTAVCLGAFRAAAGELATATTIEAHRLALVERLAAASERIGRTGRALADSPGDGLREDLEEARTEFGVLLRQLGTQPAPIQPALSRLQQSYVRYVDALDRLLAAMRDRSSPPSGLVAELQSRRESLDASLEAWRSSAIVNLQRAEDAAFRGVSRTFHLLLAGAAASFAIIAALGVLLARALGRLQAQRIALVRANTQLRSANDDLDAFAGRVAHDLRNLLTPIDLSLSSLASKPADAVAVVRQVERARRASARSQTLIRDLLDFARAGRAVQSGTPASLPAVVHEVLCEFESQREQADVTVVVDVDQIEVLCPPALLHMVVANLVGNAFKFLAGHQHRQVTISASVQNTMAVFEVTDTGPGIPAENLDLVFRPFFRSEGVHQPGTGLGLAIVRRIAEAYGGTARVHSTAAGARFCVALPAAFGTQQTAGSHAVAEPERRGDAVPLVAPGPSA
jgi:signal transduction histidine kinase